MPENPDEEKFRRTARELKIDEEEYIRALQKVNVKTTAQNQKILSKLREGIGRAATQVVEANDTGGSDKHDYGLE